MASMVLPSVAFSSSSGRRDRPWLLPSNRRLRNLVSISLRNLSFEHRATGRTRGKTIDDDALPQTLKSPAKIVAQREFRGLEHSRSSEDLKTLSGSKSSARSGAVDDDIVEMTPRRPLMKRMRRRSTMEWASATPQRRQERLERVTQEKLADVFFSLHVHAFEDPIYISETVTKTMDPTFRHIDFSACGPAVARLNYVILRVWVKISKAKAHWKEWASLEISLEKLEYLGKSLDQLHFSLPPNVVILHLVDGVYTPRMNIFTPLLGTTPIPVRANSNRILPTSSFDALLRLSNLDDSIQDALDTRNRLAADLEALFTANKDALNDREQLAEADDRLKTIDYAKRTIEKQKEKAIKQLAEKRESLAVRRNLMQADVTTRVSTTEEIHQFRPEFSFCRDELAMKKQAIRNQRRRVCEDLQKIYPVIPVPGKSLDFIIRGLHLPNSQELEGENSDTVAAAFGSIAHVLMLLAFYLQQPLTYPIAVRGSSSTICDPISLLKSSNTPRSDRHKDERLLRTYPLFSRGAPRFKFEYGVFLLNKDIQLLLESAFNVRVLDIRHTLPNLKYLLYVATAGEGELPARKAGGVRGLLRARKGGNLVERRVSEDSLGSTLVDGVSGSADGELGNAKKLAMDSLRRNMGTGKKY